MFDTLVQYWRLTGDAQYNEIITQVFVNQQGSERDFMPINQTKSLGNDDQSFWALATMSVAEARLGEVQNHTWFDLANSVFNEQTVRWDDKTCNGGLRWQVFSFNNGYTYKNSISNGNFFQLAARLAVYTGNSTYFDWATKTWNWTKASGIVNDDFNVFDGADISENCSSVNRIQFSESAGTFVAGAAYMYNHTNRDNQWKTSLYGLLNKTISIFFPSGIAKEIPCESKNVCNVDQRAFKGVLGKWLVDTIQVAPYIEDIINSKLTTTAQAAVKSCSDKECAWDWSGKGTNSSTGVGEQIDALNYVQGLLHSQAVAPATQNTSNETKISSGGSTSISTSTSASASASSFATKNTAVGIVLGQSVLSFSIIGSIALLLL